MQSPLEFLDVFRGDLRAAGLRFAITSGMACVRYGLQQTTKVSDWILPPDQAEPLRALFARRESALPAWTIHGGGKAAWARLPPAAREAELTALHLAFDTPDDLSVWPAELDGGCDRP